MPKKLTDVVTWKARAIPGRRVIPPHLKLAILSRGRVELPTKNVRWLVDRAEARGSTWPGRLTRPLEKIFSELPVTIELFQKQFKSMTPPDIEHALQAYLTLRHGRHLSQCLYILFSAVPHSDRKSLERLLDLDISRLYSRPRVSVRARDRDRYWLVAYVCIPHRLAHYLRPPVPKAPPPPPPPQTMPALEGLTARNVERWIREQPGENAPKLGDQDGDVVPVRVLNKAKADGYEWLNIELLKPLRVKNGTNRTTLAPGTKCWLERGGLDSVVAPWDFFRHQLIAFENDQRSLGLRSRITMLRQMTHARGLPFDPIIGTGKGAVYLDDRPFDPGKWQLGKDYNAVRTPDGRSIDIQHVMVGLDVLSRRRIPARYLKIRVGTNWAAATWSGDVGAGAADMTLRTDKNWERRNPKASFAERCSYYFGARAPDWDLLADIDAWALNAQRRSRHPTIDAILTPYYEKTRAGGNRALTTDRQDALERFLAHYGFTYDFSTDMQHYPALLRQRDAVGRLAGELILFAQIWMYYRNPALIISRNKKKRKPAFNTVPSMNSHLIHWLEYAAIENGVSIVQGTTP